MYGAGDHEEGVEGEALGRLQMNRYKYEFREHFTEKQIEEFAEAFKMFDLDGGGTISQDELRSVFYSLGQKPSDDELQDMLPNGTDMDFHMFLILMTKKVQSSLSAEEICEAFRVVDPDDDGVVDLGDIRTIVFARGGRTYSRDILERALDRIAEVARAPDPAAVGVAGIGGGGGAPMPPQAPHADLGGGYPTGYKRYIDFGRLVRYMMRSS